MLPVRDVYGELHSIEFITEDGAKLYLVGGRVRGCYFPIGKPQEILSSPKASLQQPVSTRLQVMRQPARSTLAITAVAKALREKFPKLRIVLAADDDRSGTGKKKAAEAAQAVSGEVALPDFGADRADEAKDFNDLMRIRGAAAVIACIQGATAPERVEIAPEPLARPVPAPALLPLEKLGPVLAPAAERIQQAVRAPAAMCVQSVLTAAVSPFNI